MRMAVGKMAESPFSEEMIAEATAGLKSALSKSALPMAAPMAAPHFEEVGRDDAILVVLATLYAR